MRRLSRASGTAHAGSIIDAWEGPNGIHERINAMKMPTLRTAETVPQPPLTVFFDGGCPVCTREIALYRRRPGAETIRWVNVASEDPADYHPELSREAALARMHGLEGTTLISGAAVFRAMWARLDGWRWAARLTGLPPVSWCMEAGYRGFLVIRKLWRRPQPTCSP